MKRFSIKLKVTIWFTLVLTFIVASVLALLLIIGEKVVFEETQEKLINAVKLRCYDKHNTFLTC